MKGTVEVSLHHLPLPTPIRHPEDTATVVVPQREQQSGGSTWLKGRGANPALSCPQVPCTYYGPWGASPQLTLTVTQGRHFAGEEGPRPLSWREQDGERQWSWAGTPLELCPEPPAWAQPSNTCSKEHCSPNLIFSPTHISNSPLNPQMGCGTFGKKAGIKFSKQC